MVLFILIFFIMIITVGASSVVGFSLFLKRRTKRLNAESAKQFDAPPVYKSLFAPSDEEIQDFEREENARREMEEAKQHKQSLVSRAASNDFTALKNCGDDKNLYDEVLTKLTAAAKSGEQITALVKYILTNKLRSNAESVTKFGTIWSGSFDKSSTLDYLEFAARSGDAKIYLKVLEAVGEARHNGLINNISESDFVSLAKADFWLLSDDERASGAGFSVKEKLAEMSGE